jgi:hypothetical protein
MLFTVSFGFILLNLPFAIKTIYERNFKEKQKFLDFLYNYDENHVFTKLDIETAVKYDFFVYLTHFLLDLNYIANFFFYFLSGSRFRIRLYDLICCKEIFVNTPAPSRHYTQNTQTFKIRRLSTSTTMNMNQK